MLKGIELQLIKKLKNLALEFWVLIKGCKIIRNYLKKIKKRIDGD